jgi:hypothetical protein
MSYVNVEFKPNVKTENALLSLSDRTMYKIARMTLDFTTPHIPMSRGKATSGQLRRSTLTYGVRGGNGDYTIGSITSYARYVYDMDAEKTNWTTDNTYSNWFHTTYKSKQAIIYRNAVEQAWKEE